MMASRFGLDENGIGGDIPVFRFGAVPEVTGEGRFVGTGGGADSLLLKPISRADRRGGGGTIALLTRLVTLDVSFEACRCGNAGTGRGACSLVVDCLGGNEGLAGKSTYPLSVTFAKSA